MKTDLELKYEDEIFDALANDVIYSEDELERVIRYYQNSRYKANSLDTVDNILRIAKKKLKAIKKKLEFKFLDYRIEILVRK